MRDRLWTNIILLALTIWLFLFSVSLLGFSSGNLGSTVVEKLINATANPFISLFIGLLATAIIQSSSTVTSMTVALVGAGTLNFSAAIPIILGANIGTTLTSNLVALAHVTSRNQFGRAFATSSAHNLFNLLGTALLFPLEYYFHVLSMPAKEITKLIGLRGGSDSGLEKGITTMDKLSDLLLSAVGHHAWILLLISMVLIFVSIRSMTNLIRKLFIRESQRQLERSFFGNKYRSLGNGILSTALVQSSSLTTSLTIPLVATKRVSLSNALPFIIGANIGTTITALIASLQQSVQAQEVALVHLFFNLYAAILFFPKLPLGRFHEFISQRLGDLVKKERLLGFLYVLMVFFLLPFVLIIVSGGFDFN